MNFQVPTTALQLHSLVTKDGELQLSLARVAVEAPGADEVLVRIEGAPINPSDLGLLIGPADMKAARVAGKGAETVVSAPIAPQFMRMMAMRAPIRDGT